MYANRPVKVRFGGARLKRDCKALHHFTGIGADHVQADDAVCFSVDQQLHERALGAA